MPNLILSYTLRAGLTTSLMLAAMAGAAVAGPYEDGVAAYVRGDYATALRLMRPFADHGLAAAQNNLGLMYYSGLRAARKRVQFPLAQRWLSKQRSGEA